MATSFKLSEDFWQKRKTTSGEDFTQGVEPKPSAPVANFDTSKTTKIGPSATFNARFSGKNDKKPTKVLLPEIGSFEWNKALDESGAGVWSLGSFLTSFAHLFGDEDQAINAAVKNIPGAKEGVSPDGSRYVSIGDKEFIYNKQGISQADFGQFAAEAARELPIALLSQGQSLKGTIAKSFVTGGLSSAMNDAVVNSVSAEELSDIADISTTDVLMDAGFSAIGGFLGDTLGPALGAGWNKLKNAFSSGKVKALSSALDDADLALETALRLKEAARNSGMPMPENMPIDVATQSPSLKRAATRRRIGGESEIHLARLHALDQELGQLTDALLNRFSPKHWDEVAGLEAREVLEDMVSVKKQALTKQTDALYEKALDGQILADVSPVVELYKQLKSRVAKGGKAEKKLTDMMNMILPENVKIPTVDITPPSSVQERITGVRKVAKRGVDSVLETTIELNPKELHNKYLELGDEIGRLRGELNPGDTAGNDVAVLTMLKNKLKQVMVDSMAGLGEAQSAYKSAMDELDLYTGGVLPKIFAIPPSQIDRIGDKIFDPRYGQGEAISEEFTRMAKVLSKEAPELWGQLLRSRIARNLRRIPINESEIAGMPGNLKDVIPAGARARALMGGSGGGVQERRLIVAGMSEMQAKAFNFLTDLSALSAQRGQSATQSFQEDAAAEMARGLGGFLREPKKKILGGMADMVDSLFTNHRETLSEILSSPQSEWFPLLEQVVKANRYDEKAVKNIFRIVSAAEMKTASRDNGMRKDTQGMLDRTLQDIKDWFSPSDAGPQMLPLTPMAPTSNQDHPLIKKMRGQVEYD